MRLGRLAKRLRSCLSHVLERLRGRLERARWRFVFIPAATSPPAVPANDDGLREFARELDSLKRRSRERGEMIVFNAARGLHLRHGASSSGYMTVSPGAPVKGLVDAKLTDSDFGGSLVIQQEEICVWNYRDETEH